MTPLVIGIDPGTKQSAYVAWDGNFIQALGTEDNLKVAKYLRTIDPRACVVFESIESYGAIVGKSVFETAFWTGRLFQVARDTVGPKQVSRLPRRIVKKHLQLGRGAGDPEVRRALIRRFGVDRHPEDWHGVKKHQWSALAIAVTLVGYRAHTSTLKDAISSGGGSMKRCSRCHVDKPESEFPIERRNRSGLSSACRKCTTEYKTTRQRQQDATSDVPRWKRYYEENKQAAIARARSWREKNIERYREIARRSALKAYHKVPRPGRKQKPMRPCHQCGQPVWSPASAVKKGIAKYCSKACFNAAVARTPNRNCSRCGTPYYASKQQRERWNTRFCSMKCKATGLDPVKLATSRLRAAGMRRARKVGASIVEPINYRRIEARDKMRCHICRKKVIRRKDLNFDHVIPLAKGGTHTEVNIAVSHKRCNLKKHDKVLTLF